MILLLTLRVINNPGLSVMILLISCTVELSSLYVNLWTGSVINIPNNTPLVLLLI